MNRARGRDTCAIRIPSALLALVLVARAAHADIAALGSQDPQAVAAAVAEIERGPSDAEALFAAGRACEDKLADPARALAIYERILRDAPDARVAAAADRRAEKLRVELGPHGEHAPQAAGLAALIAGADALPVEQVIARANELTAAAWPGAPDTALWLAEWLRRHAQFVDAETRYLEIIARWPDSPAAASARRGAAGAALDAHDWDVADQLARALPDGDPVRDEVVAAVAGGRLRDRLYVGAWLALALAFAALLASLAEACTRGGWRRPRLRPPIEVMFLAPIATVLVAASFTANRVIAPAVTLISAVGLALAWLSGTVLDVLRTRGRAVRARSLAHVAACFIGVVAVGYIAMTRDGLVDLLAETVKFGPGS